MRLVIRVKNNMTAEELWKKSGLTGNYDAWAFGDDADRLAELVKKGIKTATSSLLCFYELEGEELPGTSQYNIILDSQNQAVCIIRTKKVYVTTFDKISENHAYKEGEGDRSLEYWKSVHRDFFTKELKTIGKHFSTDLEIVCEEFEVMKCSEN